MNEGVVNMINSGKLSVREFFLLHPFSAIENNIYEAALKGVNYWNTFYAVSNKTYERLVSVEKVTESGFRNTIIFTGYRGCGKTNFLRYCKAIIDGEVEVQDFDKTRQIYYDNFQDVEGIPEDILEDVYENEKERIEKAYSETTRNISISIRSPEIKNMPKEVVEKKIAPYLTTALRGDSDYINFDAGRANHSKPLELILTNRICILINEIIKCDKFETVLEFYNGTDIAIRDVFEGIRKLHIDDFFNVLTDDMPVVEKTMARSMPLYSCGNRKKITKAIRPILDEMEIDQLCFLYILLKIFNKIINNNKSRLFVFIDNIDVIAKNGDANFTSAISKFWDFIHEMNSFCSELSSNEYDSSSKEQFINIYMNTTFIIAMRETTAIHITEHVRERMRQFSIHHDISKDYNVAISMYKRCLFLDRQIEKGSITNANFIKVYNCISRIRNDLYFKTKISLLINNDYKRLIACLSRVCSEHTNEVSDALNLIDKGNDFTKFGGRAYILRLILNSFKDSGYFSKLRITNLHGANDFKDDTGYSLCRIILLLLSNIRRGREADSDDDYFFSPPDKLISYENLLSFVENLDTAEHNVSNQVPELLTDMFSLRNEETWNHLVAFDNVIDFNRKFLRLLTDAIKDGDNYEKVYLRATLAGKAYLQYISMHFEYFACRFSRHNVPLFACDAISGGNKYKQIINVVYDQVKLCCDTLKKIYTVAFNNPKYKGVIPIAFLQGPKNGDYFMHEERIIHHHIAYLEAYRVYQVSYKCKPYHPKFNDFNDFMLKTIRNYLEILNKSKDYYSENSKSLYFELTECVQVLERKPSDTSIRITRDYYNKHIKPNKI